MYERREKPNFLVYLAYLGLFLVALNTVYLVLPNDQIKWYLMGTLVVAVLSGYLLSSKHYVTIGLLLDILGLSVFILYGWKIYQDRYAFGTYLGEMLSLMLVLRCFKLFRFQDFLAPLVICLTLMIFTAIPSFSADYVYSVMGFMIMLGLALFLGSVDEFARLPAGKAIRKRWRYTYDFLEEYAPVPVSKKAPKQVLKYFAPAVKASVPAVLLAFFIASAFYFTIDHTHTPATNTDFLASFGGAGFDQDEGQEEDLLTGQSSRETAQYYTGFDTEFNIARGRLIENSTSMQVVMEVESNLPSYWRGKAFDTYTGRGWHQSDKVASTTWSLEPPKGQWIQFHGQHDDNLEADGIIRDPDPDGIKDEIRQVYHLKASLPGIVFTAYQPVELQLPVPAVKIDDTFTIESPPSADSMVAGQSYEVVSYKQNVLGNILNNYDYDLKALQEEDPDFYARYTQLPETGGSAETLNGGVGFDFTRIRAKAFEVTAGSDTVFEKVQDLKFWLSKNYSFSTSPPSAVPPEKDAVSYFLFDWEYQRGHCEYFSSSLAVMCRSIGIPTRVATGYTPGNYNIMKNRYIVQERHAHAWTEIYWPEVGWVEFDAMPVAWYQDIREKAAGGWLLFHNAVENLYVYNPRGFINTRVMPLLMFVADETPAWLKDIGLDFEASVDPFVNEYKNERGRLVLMLSGAFTLLIGIIYVRRRLDTNLEKRYVLHTGNKSLRRIRKFMIKQGIDPDLLATETDCVVQAAILSEKWAESVETVADTYQSAKYSAAKVTATESRTIRRASKSARKFPRT